MISSTRLIIFEGNMTASRFTRFLDLLIKDAKVLYPCGKFRVYFDKDFKHTSKTTKDFVAKNSLNVPND